MHLCRFVPVLFIIGGWCHAWADGPKFGQLLSPALTVTQQTQHDLQIEWALDEGASDTVLHALLALPGPIQHATQSVVSFDWQVHGATPQSGDQADFKKKNPRRTQPRLTIHELGYLAGARIASMQLRFYYSSAAEDTVSFPNGKIRVQFNQLDPMRFDGFPNDIAPIASALLLNEPLRTIASTKEFAVAPYHETRAVKLVHQTQGAVSLRASDLLGVFEQDLDSSRLALFQQGEPIPRAIINNDGAVKRQGLLTDGDSIVFHAPASDSAFATETVTWFAVDPESARVFEETTQKKQSDRVVPLLQTKRLEQDHIFIDGKSTNEEQNQHWMWADLLNQATPEFDYRFNETAFSATGAIKMRFYIGNVRSELLVKHVTPALDGTLIDWTVSTGTGYITATGDVSRDLITKHTHRLSFKGVDSATTQRVFDELYLDWFDVSYATNILPSTNAYQTPPGELVIPLPDLSRAIWLPDDESQPATISNNDSVIYSYGAGDLYVDKANRFITRPRLKLYDPTSLAVNDLLNLSQSDVVLIAPSDWRSTLAPFRDSLMRLGYTVRTASIEAIYDRFGDGGLSPFAVREFLRYAYQTWKRPSPSYVLLIGDASWDYHNRYGVGVKNYVPGYRAHPNYAVENWFVCLDGEGDAAPDMMIGRWPLRSKDELATLIHKTVRYKEEIEPAPWLNKMFVLTDHGFDRFTEELVDEWIPQGFRLAQRHVKEYPLIDNIYLPEKLRAANRAKTSLAATRDVIRILNEGVWLMQFFGHGAPNVVGNERLFFGGGSRFTDVKKLTNQERPFLFWSFSCETTTFDYPRQKWNISIGEDLLIHPNGGAVGLLGAAGRGYPHDHIILARGIHEALFHYGLSTMGQVLLAGNLIGLAYQQVFEPADQFCFLGDPTIRLPEFRPLQLAVNLQGSQIDLQQDGRSFNRLPQHAAAWARSGSDVVYYATMQNKLEPIAAQFDMIGHDGLIVGAEALSKRDGRIVVSHGAQPFEREAPAIIEPTTGRLPDLVIQPGSVRVTPPSPRSGETIFLSGVIENKGGATALDVFVQGSQAPVGQKKAPFHVVVGQRGERIERLDPGESKPVRLRWDPTANPGRFDLEMTVDPFGQIEEDNDDNNTHDAAVTVRRKADLLVEEDRFQLTPIEDGKRVRVDFSIINNGESPVEKLLIEMAFAYQGSDKRLKHYVPEIVSLGPGQRYTANRIRIPANIQYFEIVIDPDERVDEETHQNNTFRFTVE